MAISDPIKGNPWITAMKDKVNLTESKNLRVLCFTCGLKSILIRKKEEKKKERVF